MLPSVTMVTICYRNPGDLRDTLASAIALDHSRVECLVVDGSPDDSCAKICAEFDFVRHEQGRDTGKYDAMNKGAQRASGSALIYMNSGDAIVSADTFMALVDRVDALPNHLVYGDCIRLIGGKKLHTPAPPISSAGLRIGTLPSHQSIFIPAEYQRRHPYDDRMEFAADTKFLKQAFRDLPHVHVAEPVSLFAFGGASSSPGRWSALAKQYRELCEAHELTGRERIGTFFLLFRRKIAHLIAGEAFLQSVQARRLARAPGTTLLD